MWVHDKSTPYRWESYIDNWANEQATLPPNVKGNQAFAVVKPDGTFDPTFDIDNPGAGITGLAIGGWYNSQSVPGPHPWSSNNGLYQVMTSSDPAARQNLIQTIISAVKRNNYDHVVIDFEDYSHLHREGGNYNQFLKDLNQALKELSPSAGIEIAISASGENRDYYNMQDLIDNIPDLLFHVMCYDFAMGQPGQPVVTPNAAVAQTLAYLQDMIDQGIPPERLMIGVPSYGLAYNLPPGMTVDQVIAGMNRQGGLPATSYWTGDCPAGCANDGNGQMDVDQLFKLLGNTWDPDPSSGWHVIIHNNEVFYFNPTGGNQGNGVMISANPAVSVTGQSTSGGQTTVNPIQNFANMIKQHFPNVSGFFNWEARENETGSTMQALINYLS